MRSVPRDQLLSLCSPASLEQGNRKGDVTNTLRKWENLGLFVEEGNELRLDPPPPRNCTTEHIRQHSREVCLRFANNENLFEKEQDNAPILAQDLTRAIGWFLAQDVYSCVLRNSEDAGAREYAQFGSSPLNLENDTRWQGFSAWVLFLGFGWHDGMGLISDPSIAVRDALPEVFSEESELQIDVFLKRLSMQLPVLDGGDYRLRVEERLAGQGVWHPPREHQISTSLSIALRRMELEGRLSLEERSDSPSTRALLGRDQAMLKRATHVRRFNGGK